MTVLDAACLIALFRAEPGAAAVATLIGRGAGLSVINRAEVIDRLARQGADVVEVTADIDMLDLDTHDVTCAIGDRAGALRAKYYHRTRSPLSLSDCIAAATALDLELSFATSDQHLADLASALGIVVVAVANSQGQSPSTG